MTHLLSIIPPVVAAAAYLGLSFAEGAGLTDALSVIDKLGGAGLAAVIAYLVIRYLLNEREKDAEKIERLHKERLETAEAHYREIKALLQDKK